MSKPVLPIASFGALAGHIAQAAVTAAANALLVTDGASGDPVPPAGVRAFTNAMRERLDALDAAAGLPPANPYAELHDWLNTLCTELGCPPGAIKMFWLPNFVREQRRTIADLRKELQDHLQEEARPESEWYEELGDCLWWKFPVEEAPYVGSPLDVGFTVEMHGPGGLIARGNVGGWPGYHTHFTRLPKQTPVPAP